jgi:hypothetical protein
MPRPATLSRERIVEAAVALADAGGAEALTVRSLGAARHFADVDELHRAVGDHFLGGVDVAPRHREGWRSAVRRLCVELRRAQLRQPRLAAFVRAAPTRMGNELAITEALLRELGRGGLGPAEGARAYHALIELTVGSATIDAPLAAEDETSRAVTYRNWRDDYASLPAELHPSIAAVAPHLYRGTADDRFEHALDLLLDGLASRRNRSH